MRAQMLYVRYVFLSMRTPECRPNLPRHSESVKERRQRALCCQQCNFFFARRVECFEKIKNKNKPPNFFFFFTQQSISASTHRIASVNISLWCAYFHARRGPCIPLNCNVRIVVNRGFHFFFFIFFFTYVSFPVSACIRVCIQPKGFPSGSTVR